MTTLNRAFRTFLAVVGPCLIAVSHAQDAAPDARWSIGATGWAGAAHRMLINTDGSALAARIIDLRNDREHADLALGVGLLANYRLSARFSLEAGAAYARFGYAHDVALGDLSFGDPIDPRRGFIYNTDDFAMPSSWRFVDRFHYLQLPLGVVMELGQGRWRSTTTLGAAPAFLLAAKGLTVRTYGDGRVERERFEPLEDFASFNLIAYLGTGVAFSSSERWQWQLRPTLQYGALRIIDAPVSARIGSLTLNAGVRMAL
jgi:hypothetical protein